jgi:hypothetical protein
MTRVRTIRLVCSSLRADVRLSQLRGRWLASADTPDGPSLGVAWFPVDALEAALEPFDGFVDDLLATVPEDLQWR